MHVDEELPDGALHAGEPALEHREARAGELCGGLEVHLAQVFAQFEVLLWRKRIIALRPEVMVLDVVVLVLAVGHFGCRQIRNRGERVVQFPRIFLLLCFQRRHRRLDLVDLGHQRGRGDLVASLLSLETLRGSFLTPRLCLLCPLDCVSALLIKREDRRRLRWKPAPRKARVEASRVFANPFDVVHGGLLARNRAAL